MMRNRGTPDFGRLTTIGAGVFLATSACLLLILGAAVVFVHPTVSVARPQNATTVGGLHYDITNAWILDPRRRVDADVARGLPTSDQNVGPNELLYAVFVGVTNESDRRLPMATDVALVDGTNHEYAPVPLGAANRFAYRPRPMAPQTHRPAQWTPAGKSMSAEGLMLVFRIPRSAYEAGSLELVVHDPGHPETTRSLEVL
jgi:hypothetical protein